MAGRPAPPGILRHAGPLRLAGNALAGAGAYAGSYMGAAMAEFGGAGAAGNALVQYGSTAGALTDVVTNPAVRDSIIRQFGRSIANRLAGRGLDYALTLGHGLLRRTALSAMALLTTAFRAAVDNTIGVLITRGSTPAIAIQTASNPVYTQQAMDIALRQTASTMGLPEGKLAQVLAASQQIANPAAFAARAAGDTIRFNPEVSTSLGETMQTRTYNGQSLAEVPVRVRAGAHVPITAYTDEFEKMTPAQRINAQQQNAQFFDGKVARAGIHSPESAQLRGQYAAMNNAERAAAVARDPRFAAINAYEARRNFDPNDLPPIPPLQAPQANLPPVNLPDVNLSEFNRLLAKGGRGRKGKQTRSKKARSRSRGRSF